MQDKSQKIILIDGNALIHRAYHALPPLKTKQGELVNAVYGFSSTVLSVISQFQPNYMIATFDLAAPTFRHKEYVDYKATRIKADQELYDQIPRVKEVTRAMGIPIVEKEGFEADDIIGTLSYLVEKYSEKMEIIIVTGDLDTLQLASKKTKIYTMRRGLSDAVLYDENKIYERYGISSKQLIDFKGLRGDPSDNIPGVFGIGEKTAVSLLQEFETLENIYKNIEKIKISVREKLTRDKMQAIKSKKLATIVRNVPVEFDLEKAKIDDFDKKKLVKLFEELNFFSLIKRIPQNKLDESENCSKKEKKNKSVKDFKYNFIIKEKENDFWKDLSQKKELSFKLETQERENGHNEILGVSFSWESGRAGYAKYSEKNRSFIKDIFENEKIVKIGYDLKISIKILFSYGIILKGKLYDIMLLAYVLDPGAKIDFPFLVLKELGEEIEERNNKGQLGLEIMSFQEKIEKICRQTDYIKKLKKIFEEKMEKISQTQKKQKNLETVFWEIEIPLVEILAQMEMNGILLNAFIFQGISQKIGIRISNLEKNIYELAGEKFNINSPKQLKKILFEKLQISTNEIKKGKTGFSTASQELQKIRKEHKIVEKIEEYREIFKIKNTYLDVLPNLRDENSRVHTTFNQAITATGRLSSSDPNLQNIPIRTQLGQLLRVAFEAEKGFKLISADYSQIDLRVMAHMSEDKKMIDLFWAGEDIHQATAMEINKISASKVTQKLRNSAKALNFGIIYGMSVFGFSEVAGIGRDDAKKFIDEYMKKFQGVADYIRKIKMFAQKNGFVETEFGRRRLLPEINSSNFKVQNSVERMAINMPIQGMSADIVKLAMIKVYEKFKDYSQVKMLLQIHDEIIFEVKEEIADETGKKIKEIMESVYKLKVPLTVDVKIGDNWGEI